LEIQPQRVRIDCAYHGSVFCGWQIQPEQRSVQGELMAALKKLYGQDIRVIGAGRTDAGVHALQQVAHFDLPHGIKGPPIENLRRALNALTPPELSILELERVEPEFHARFSPHIKTYTYHFDAHDQPHPMLRDRAFHVRERLTNPEAIQSFCELIVGTHDFGSFCSIQNATETTVRTLVSAHFAQNGSHEWVFKVQGKGFLQHMVRILAGTLLGVGHGKISLSQIKTILEQGTGYRDRLGLTLPAQGLWLEKTEYV
jgi:tRNA pseudouridine38-40 synthase